jgi:hypothetical protein
MYSFVYLHFKNKKTAHLAIQNKTILKNLLYKFYHKTLIGNLVRFLYHRTKERIWPEKLVMKVDYKRRLGKSLNLSNPVTLNEKINWLKLYDRKPIHTICADKLEVRNYISSKIGEEYLVPLIFSTKDPSEIKPERLPNIPVVVKTNHDSGGVYIIRDKNRFDYNKLQESLQKRLKVNYYLKSKEWQYKNIEPKIVVEKLLMDSDGNIPEDYKLHCFNGKLVFTQVDLERHTDHKRNLYDIEWKRIPCRWIYENGDEVPKPLNYSKMKDLAEKIASDFTYVRVDFYNVGESIFFGELTFHSESGYGKFIPDSYDLYFGKLLNINTSGKKN